MNKIKFPKKIINDYQTIKFFNDLLNYEDEIMLYDMKGIEFFEASLVTYFHSINIQLFKTHKAIMYNDINKTIEAFFIKNKYASKFNSKYVNVKLEDIYKTYIEFTELKRDEEDGFYIIENRIKKKKIINYNDDLRKNFISLIGELTNNSYEHGETERAYFCGQYFPKIGKISFSISNLGKTIQENAHKINLNIKNKDLMDWIFRNGTSTRCDDTFGGQGLYQLKKIVMKLNGKITVISGYDYYVLENNKIAVYKILNNMYKGTTFIIHIDTDRR